jgi:hypothetical protein
VTGSLKSSLKRTIQCLSIIAWACALTRGECSFAQTPVWRCGNLLTNQAPTPQSQSAGAECRTISLPPASVTVSAPKGSELYGNSVKGQDKTTDKVGHLAQESLLKKDKDALSQPNSLNAKLSREGQSKLILLSERERLSIRLGTLEQQGAFSSAQGADTRKLEIEQVQADLRGIDRELSKLP